MPRPTKEILGLTRMTPKGLRELCKKNQLYQTPGLNDVLYLHYQGFQQIECLDEYTGLKCLWLENNAISDIEGLDNQKILKCLFLHNNLISRINNLGNCRELDTVNLSYNHITKIENCGVEVLPVLTSLNLSHNYIKTFDQVENLIECKNLSVLDLANNRIEDILIVTVLAQMPELRVLVLQGNPVVNKIPQYRKTLILECKQLTYLDQRPVFPKDRACAEAWKRGGYDEERREHDRWIKAEQKKIRDSVNATLRLRNRGGGEPQVQLILSSDDEDDGATERSSAPTLEDELKLKTQEAEAVIMREFLKLGDLAKDYTDPTIPSLCFVCHRLNCKAEHPRRRIKKKRCTETPEDIMESTYLFIEDWILVEDEDSMKDLLFESEDTKDVIENVRTISSNEPINDDFQDEELNEETLNDDILPNSTENDLIKTEEKPENTDDILDLLDKIYPIEPPTEEPVANDKIDDIKYIDIKYIDKKTSSPRQNSTESKSDELSAKGNKKRVRIAIEQINSDVDVVALKDEPEEGINEPKRKRVDDSAVISEAVASQFVDSIDTKSDSQIIVTANKFVQVDIGDSPSRDEVDGCIDSQEAECDLEVDGLAEPESPPNIEESTNQVLKEHHHHACTQTSFIKASENRSSIQSLLNIITVNATTNDDSKELLEIDTKPILEPEQAVLIEDVLTPEVLPARASDDIIDIDDIILQEHGSSVIYSTTGEKPDTEDTSTEDPEPKEILKERVLHLIKPVNIFSFNADDPTKDTQSTELSGPPIDIHQLLDFHKYNMPDHEDTEDTKAVLRRMCNVNYEKNTNEAEKVIEEDVIEKPNLAALEPQGPSFKDAVFFVSKPQNNGDRTRSVESLLNNPLTRKMSDELKAISPEDLEEQVENAKELKFERISKLVNCVFAKKDRYDDDLEVVDNKLVVVRKEKPKIEPIMDKENSNDNNTENIVKKEEKVVIERKIFELEDIIEEVELESSFDDNNAAQILNIVNKSDEVHIEESSTAPVCSELNIIEESPSKSKIEEINNISCEGNINDSLENISDVYATPPLISSSFEELSTSLEDTEIASFGNGILLTSTRTVSLYDNKADCSEPDKPEETTNEMEEYYAYDIEDVTRLCSEQTKRSDDEDDENAADEYFLGPKYDDILYSIDQSFKKDLVVLLDDCCKEYALSDSNATEGEEQKENSDDEDDINNKSYDKYWKHYNGDIEEYRKALKLETHPLIVELNKRLKQNRTITDEEFNNVLPKFVLAHKEYLLNHEDVEAQELAKKILKDNDLPTE